jgi:hypothetical protein
MLLVGSIGPLSPTVNSGETRSVWIRSVSIVSKVRTSAEEKADEESLPSEENSTVATRLNIGSALPILYDSNTLATRPARAPPVNN